MPEVLGNICRMCLSSEGWMFPIFQNKELPDALTFRYKIMACADLEVYADDGLPSTICHHCVHSIEKYFAFRNKCEKSDAILRCHLQERQTFGESNDQLEVNNLNEESNSKDNEGKDTLQSGQCLKISKLSERVESVSKSYKNWNNDESHCVCCPVCCSDFTHYTVLMDHMKKEHPGVQTFPCSACDVSFLSAFDARKHIYECHSDSYRCTRCDKVFKYEKSLEEHKHYHEQKNFVCKFCKLSFYNEGLLSQHEANHLAKRCNYCSEEYTSRSVYEEHALICKKLYKCSFCDNLFTIKKDLIEHVNSNHENPVLVKCEHCNKSFKKLSELTEHICISQESFKCDVCNMHFDTVALLTTHVAQHASLFKCKFCSKKFTLRSSVRRHEKSHSGLKPYLCKFCPKRFKDNSTCIVHTRTHTGEQPFECKECHKHFRQLANLKMHTYRHHKKNKNENKDPLSSEADFKMMDSNQIIPPEDESQLYQNQTITQNDLHGYTIEQNRVYDHLSLEVGATF